MAVELDKGVVETVPSFGSVENEICVGLKSVDIAELVIITDAECVDALSLRPGVFSFDEDGTEFVIGVTMGLRLELELQTKKRRQFNLIRCQIKQVARLLNHPSCHVTL